MADEEQEYYGYYYGDDEDRGLLDTAWENQQKKVCVWARITSIGQAATRVFITCIINDIYALNLCILYKHKSN